ncbi:MAG: succinyl-diaminopimelate desuccinylase [Pyrinomonadaceae bacterium]
MNLFELTRKLVDIPSVTGDEAAVGRFLASYLESLDYRVELQEVAPERFNVIATTTELPRVVLSTHMDVVPPHIVSSETDEHIFGRGACDAKGIIAAQITAAEELRAAGVETIGLLFTVDEELGSAGARAANTHRLARDCQYLINGEPTENKLAIGSKGTMRVLIKTQGRAAHSAYPEQGDSAIEKLLDILADVRKLELPRDDFFGATTCNIGTIAGGLKPNVIAPNAQAELLFRLVTASQTIKDLVHRVINHRAEIEFPALSEPQRMLAIDGIEQTIVRFATDIPHLSNWGQPLLLGPGSILVAHTNEEKVSKIELEESVRLYKQLVRTLFSRIEKEAHA